MTQRGIAEERPDRREPRVAGAGAVVAVPLEVVQEVADELGVEIADVEPAGLRSVLGLDELQQQPSRRRDRRRWCWGWRDVDRRAGQ